MKKIINFIFNITGHKYSPYIMAALMIILMLVLMSSCGTQRHCPWGDSPWRFN
jgi:hypothetical protein